MRKIVAYLPAAALGLLLVVLWCVRFAAFTVLMFLRPVFGLLFGAISAGCLIGLVIGLIIAREHHEMLWTFFGLGLGSGVLLFCYDALVLMLAPDRFPMLLAR